MLFKLKGDKYAKILSISQNFAENVCVVGVHIMKQTRKKTESGDGEDIIVEDYEIIKGININIPTLSSKVCDEIGKLVVDSLKEEKDG
jgi:hypothetical protein